MGIKPLAGFYPTAPTGIIPEKFFKEKKIMKTCQDCGVVETENNFYKNVRVNGKAYPIEPNSTADLTCKDCLKITSTEMYADVKKGHSDHIVATCVECGEKGTSALFYHWGINSHLLGFPVGCKICKEKARAIAREAWPQEKKDAVEAAKREYAAKYREEKRLKKPKTCVQCSITKRTRDFRKLESKPHEHHWYDICKVCEGAE